jgi:hypothetical protein
LKNPPEMESPDERLERRFYAEFEEQPSAAMVLSNGAGNVFWIRCGLCLGDEVRKAPRRYQDKAEAQYQADLHNETAHRGQQ